ncbi:DsbA family oxidoreductase [Macromonas nakdongensis]|uniref:DsbA family oxidoreductase n=1 Tax=Macromonas nakdongensis TaxID=1843082 RepID=UPI000C34225B|nr:DsbA family oxidoreductase [Macromonas nakdongensis]
MSRSLNVDVYFDLICPWCLIGKRHLRDALAALHAEAPEVEVALTWHSLSLIPLVPAQGLPFAEFYRQRLGSEAAVQRRQAEVRAAAERAGVPLRFDRIQTFPNTRMAHLLVQRVGAQAGAAAAEAVIDRLFDGYFVRGEDLGDAEALVALGRDWGLEPEALRQHLRAGQLPESGPWAAGAGVPLFVFNGLRSVVGAQPVERLLQVMRQSLNPSSQPVSA